jgi:hypothetical protein
MPDPVPHVSSAKGSKARPKNLDADFDQAREDKTQEIEELREEIKRLKAWNTKKRKAEEAEQEHGDSDEPKDKHKRQDKDKASTQQGMPQGARCDPAWPFGHQYPAGPHPSQCHTPQMQWQQPVDHTARMQEMFIKEQVQHQVKWQVRERLQEEQQHRERLEAYKSMMTPANPAASMMSPPSQRPQ